MLEATLSDQGRITLPEAVRIALGLQAGDRVEFIESSPGVYALVAMRPSVTRLKGLIPAPARPVAIEDMQQAIATEAASRE